MEEPTVIITVEGGCVQHVATTLPMTIVVIDHDSDEVGKYAQDELVTDVETYIQAATE